MSRYEQAKTLILAGAYEDEKMRYQLGKYYERGYLTKAEYDELIALMDARLVIEDMK